MKRPRCFSNRKIESNRLFIAGLAVAVGMAAVLASPRGGRAAAVSSPAAQGYLTLLENFAGWCEDHWNERAGAFDAAGSGVTWARGNGGVCVAYAVLLTELPEREVFSPKKIRRDVMIDHARRAIRTVALANRTCTHPDATKSNAWGGPDRNGRRGHWQAGLETEHWVVAAHLLAKHLDDDTKALVRQVATAEADLCIKGIPPARRGNTAADDCVWNAGLLGVCAAFYADDPRAAKWDDWAKRWALNTEAREPDRKSARVVDGRPLGDWLVTTQVFPDLTLENHGFWDLPYQVCFAALAEPMVAYAMCGKPIPESFHLNAKEEGEEVLKWLVLQDGDLLCPQGLDWAERDVQHQIAFAELGTLVGLPWARAAEARCLRTLLQRQAAFGDGSLHALDFGYQTDLANCWVYSYLLHKYFGKQDGGDGDTAFDEPRGAKLFPYVGAAVYRSPDMVSSVSWYGPRQAVMIVPNNAEALGEYPSLTAYRGDLREGHLSGLGHLRLEGDRRSRAFRVDAEPVIAQEQDALIVSFRRRIPNVAVQHVGFCALATGQVVVLSKWEALADLRVAQLVDHGYYWVEVPSWLPKRTAKKTDAGAWSVDEKLQIRVLGDGGTGEVVQGGLLGAVRRDFAAAKGDTLLDTACVYQPIIPAHPPVEVSGDRGSVTVGQWTIRRDDNGQIRLRSSRPPGSRRPPR